MLIDGEREFMRRVEIGDPPPPDGMGATGELLKRMYPVGNGRTVILDDPTAAEGARRFDLLKAQAKEVEKAQDAVKQTFQTILGKNEVAILPGYGKVSWKTVRPEDELECDLDRLSKDHPELFAQYVSTKPKRPYRRFLTHPLKEDSNGIEQSL